MGVYHLVLGVLLELGNRFPESGQEDEQTLTGYRGSGHGDPEYDWRVFDESLIYNTQLRNSTSSSHRITVASTQVTQLQLFLILPFATTAQHGRTETLEIRS